MGILYEVMISGALEAFRRGPEGLESLVFLVFSSLLGPQPGRGRGTFIFLKFSGDLEPAKIITSEDFKGNFRFFYR